MIGRARRRVAVALVALCALVLGGLGIRAQQGPLTVIKVRIAGVVIEAESGLPIRRATVQLIPVMPDGGNGYVFGATTDSAGRFELTQLVRGRYGIVARKTPFIPLEPEVVDIRDGQVLDGLVIRLSRGGVITGRVVDDLGDPIIETSVQLFRSDYQQGVRRLSSFKTVQTNDLGEFRFYGLTPGRFYVAATHRNSDPVRERIPFAPTFFPGVLSADRADGIPIVGGSDVRIPDFAVQPVRVARLSGFITDSEGKPAAERIVTLKPARADGAMIDLGPMVINADVEGQFSFSDLPPGDYRLDVQPTSNSAGLGDGTNRLRDTSEEFASVPVTLSGHDVGPLTIKTLLGPRVTGRVVVEGLAAPLDKAPPIDVLVGDADTMLAPFVPGGSVRLQSDGSFELRAFVKRAILRVRGTPRGWALKSVRAAGLDVTDAGLDLRQDVADVEIVLTARPARVEGIVVDASGRPRPGADVVVFPTNAEHWLLAQNRFIATTRTDAAGKFTMNPLPAAEYFVRPVQNLVPGEWAEPENLSRLAASSTRIHIGEGETRSLTLTLPR